MGEKIFYPRVKSQISLSGVQEIEMNPGPYAIDKSLSILHSNFRSTRNMLKYILKNFLDFDILYFTESHFDANITTESLNMSTKYDISNRKDRANQGGWLFMYLSRELAQNEF